MNNIKQIALLAISLMVGCKTMVENQENVDPQEFLTMIADHEPEAIETINRLTVRELNQYLFPEITPLYAAAAHWNQDAAKLLIEKGVDVDRGTVEGSPPLHPATRNNNEEMVRLLLEAGADPNKKERSYGSTPLDTAFYEHSDDAGTVLKEFGAKFSRVLIHKHTKTLATAWYDSLPSPQSP